MSGRTRPYVISRHGLSLDARILDWDTLVPRHVTSGSITTLQAADAEGADMVLTGADTMWPLPPRWSIAPGQPAGAELGADMSVDALYSDHLLPPVAGGRLYAITDSRARLPRQFYDFNLGDGAQPAWPGGPVRDPSEPRLSLVMLVARSTPAEYLAFLRQRHVSYIVRGDQRVDLAAVLEVLVEQLAIHRVLADGGSQLPTALLHENLLDEVIIHYYPVVLGQRGMTLFQVETVHSSQPIVLTPVRIEETLNGGIVARYRVAQPSHEA